MRLVISSKYFCNIEASFKLVSIQINNPPYMNKKLKLWDAVMLVMGSMIGSGIFIVASDIMRNLGSGYWLILVWLITGVMTVAAALSYGELSARFPKAGG